MIWTAVTLAQAERLTAEEWSWWQLNAGLHETHGFDPPCHTRLSWDWIIYAQRLIWLCGFDSALSTLQDGKREKAA